MTREPTRDGRGRRLVDEAAREQADSERVERRVAKHFPDLFTGTTGEEARSRPGGPGAQEDLLPDLEEGPHDREEVLERVSAEQAPIAVAQGASPAADPSRRRGFTRILHGWALVGALCGAGLGVLAGWLAVHFSGSSPALMIGLGAFGLVVGAVVVGAARAGAEDGRVDRAVQRHLDEGAGTSEAGGRE
jgi:F0F1-type ATP synthase assembly protein I